MEDILTIRLPKGTRRRLERRARAELRPQARAQGTYTDEDVFAPVALDIPARFAIDLRGIPSREQRGQRTGNRAVGRSATCNWCGNKPARRVVLRLMSG